MVIQFHAYGIHLFYRIIYLAQWLLLVFTVDKRSSQVKKKGFPYISKPRIPNRFQLTEMLFVSICR